MGSMFSKIVVGTDGSKSSHLAVRRAAGIAAAFGSELVLAPAYFAKEADAQASRRGESSAVVGDGHAEGGRGSGREAAREGGAGRVRGGRRAGARGGGARARGAEGGADPGGGGA